MPILGKVTVIADDPRLYNMKVGSSGYIEVGDIMITRRAFFVDIFSVIFAKDPQDDFEVPENLIPITRIGMGRTAKDFEIDFTHSEGYETFLQGDCLYHDLMKEAYLYIVFRQFDLEILTGEHLIQLPVSEDGRDETLEPTLEDSLREALSNEDYPKAAQIRDKIKIRDEKQSGSRKPRAAAKKKK